MRKQESAIDIDLYMLIQGVWWSSLGLGYCIYGKRTGKPIAMTCGFALMVYPYFIDSNLWVFLTGSALSFIPWRWEI